MSERWTFDRVWVKDYERIPDRWEWGDRGRPSPVSGSWPCSTPEDDERTTCATCDDSGMVSISGRPEDGPDPCHDCWPEDGER